jgi:squalene-hopene/tetraprenyl-beta-curcumene cyclase
LTRRRRKSYVIDRLSWRQATTDNLCGKNLKTTSSLNDQMLRLGCISSMLLFGCAAFAGVGQDDGDMAAAADDAAAIYVDSSHVPGFAPATAAEAFRSNYSEAKAGTFLDDIALRWTEHNKCGTCHTNIAQLMARPLTIAGNTNSYVETVRYSLLAFADETRQGDDELKTFLLAPIAGALAVNDGISGQTLDPQVAELLDYMWTVQDAGGGWSYTTEEELVPFLEQNPYYTSLLVGVGLGYVNDRYQQSPLRREGINRLVDFLRHNMPTNLHERAVLLWGSARTPELLTDAARRSIRNDLLKAQNADGGWTLPAMGDWQRLNGALDGAPNDPNGPSDGYATGLATLALCQKPKASDGNAIDGGLNWLKTHQRISGRWFTRSLYSDRAHNYLSNMATAYALMAIRDCNVNGR